MDRFYKLLQLNSLVRSHRVKFAGLLAMHHLRRRYLCLRFDPVMSCNLRCQMCYFSAPDYVKEHTARFTWEQIERFAEVFFPWTLQFYLGCSTEPTTDKRFLDILVLAKKYGVPMVGMVTNGQLLTAAHVERLTDGLLDELTLSTHGVTKETYERMMTRASFDKFLELLQTVESVKKSKGSSSPQLRVNYVVCPTNLAESSSFFQTYGHVTIRTLQVRPIIDWQISQYREMLGGYQSRYEEVLTTLRRECEERKIRLLANLGDFLHTKKTTRAALADEITVYINPESVSKPGFDWQNESYGDYCKRTGWSRTIMRRIAASPSRLAAPSPHLGYKVFD
jgi:molybdenum cofactor biosynthesis enzyme MoaA